LQALWLGLQALWLEHHGSKLLLFLLNLKPIDTEDPSYVSKKI
jgi:hypothetical protein